MTITTPSRKGSNKRRRVKQHPTPSPSHKYEVDEQIQTTDAEVHSAAQQVGSNNDENENSDDDDDSIITEEILKMYKSG